MEIGEAITLKVGSITPWPDGMDSQSVYLQGDSEDGNSRFLVSIQTQLTQYIQVNDTFEFKLLFREPKSAVRR